MFKDRRCCGGPVLANRAFWEEVLTSSADAPPAVRLLRFYRENLDQRMIPETNITKLSSAYRAAGDTEVSTCTISPRFGVENQHIGIAEWINTFFANLFRFFCESSFSEEKSREKILRQCLVRRFLGFSKALFCAQIARKSPDFLPGRIENGSIAGPSC